MAHRPPGPRPGSALRPRFDSGSSRALASGLAPEIIDAIALRAEPVFAATDERLVYAFARALQETHAIGDTLYADCVEALGERSVVELVGLLGYYTLVSMTLNAFAFTAPSDAASLAP